MGIDILLLGGGSVSEPGGPSKFVHWFQQALNAKGFRVRTFVYGPTDEFYAKSEYRVIARSRGKFYFLKTVLIYAMFNRPKLIFSNTADVEAALLSKLIFVPHVMKLVGDVPWERYRNRGGELSIEEFFAGILPLRERILYRCFALALKSASVIIVPSKYLADLVKSRYYVSDPATIYNNNVNCPSSGFCINGTKTQSSIVVVGRLVKHKNIKLIIEAFRDAKLDCYELSIIGSGPEEQGLRREFSDYTSVKFRGNLDSSQLQNVLVSASVFVNFSDYEGMSHAILEALSFNIPVIASEIQPNVELANLVGNEWITLVPTHDTKLLTKAIKNLASREALPSRPPSLELLCRDENAFIEEYLDILRSRFN